MTIYLRKNRFNIIIDGQFGSTGKGLVASHVAANNRIDIAATNNGPNAGHTFYLHGRKYVVKQLPVSGVVDEQSIIYLCAGAIINPKILLKEISDCGVDLDRVFIHPRAAVVEDADIFSERHGDVKSIASTMSGAGEAVIRKIRRTSHLAAGDVRLRRFIRKLDLNDMMSHGATILMEVPQGLDLSINSGLSYPHCTSREITVEQALSDAQVRTRFLGEVISVVRTYPIRVGNVVEDGEVVGRSGPFYEDSREVSWKELDLEDEFTTNTKRVRRVATFSYVQYKRMIKIIQPTYVVLNFINYLTSQEIDDMLSKMPEVTHLGYGPRPDDMYSLPRPKKYDRLGREI